MLENKNHSRLAAILLCLALALPFFNPIRSAPVWNWWMEALTIGLISLASLSGVFSIFRSHHVSMRVSQPATLPPAFLFGIVWLAYVQLLPFLTSGPSMYPLRSMSLVFGLAAGLLIYRLSQQQSRQRLIGLLAMMLFCGAMLQVCIGLAQALGLASKMHGLFVYNSIAEKIFISGNLGQRNQFAHCLGWGLVAGCYLYGQRKLSTWLAMSGIALIALLMTWSTSRLVLAYGCGLAVFALYWRCCNRQDENLARFVRAAMWAVLAIAITQLFTAQITHFLQWLGLPLGDLGSGASRFMEADFGGRRRVEWAKAWQIFLQHPWFGVGVGGYPYQSVWLDTYGGYPSYVEGGMFVHCHNLVMQILAETGIIGALIAGSGITWCAISFFRRGQQTCEHLFLASVLMVTLIHSMFEYPLWYLPFFAGFMIFLSLAPVRPVTLSMRPNIRVLLAAVLGGIGLWYVVSGASTVYRLVQWYGIEAHSDAELAVRLQDAQDLSLNPFWAYEADGLLAAYIPAKRTALTQDNVRLLTQLTAYRPYPVLLFKLSVMRAYEGKLQEAEDLQLMILAGSPLSIPALYDETVELKDPALQPLQQRMEQAKAIYDEDGPAAVVRWVNTIQNQRGYTLSRE